MIEDDSTLQFFHRGMSGQTRETAIWRVCDIVRSTIYIGQLKIEIFMLSNIMDPYIEKIRTHLQSSITGIQNLCGTYERDRNVVGNLEPLMKEISEYIDRVNDIFVPLDTQ